MKTLPTLIRCATLLAASFFQLASFASGPPSPAAAGSVMLTGWLHVEGYTMEDVVITIDVNGESRTGSVNENGRFDIELPVDAEATLRFEKPGHLAKEVVVDTHHSRTGDAGQKSRHVKFAVILELERWMAGLTYPGPVGNIGFDESGGCLAIDHDRRKVPAKRQAVMVF